MILFLSIMQCRPTIELFSCLFLQKKIHDFSRGSFILNDHLVFSSCLHATKSVRTTRVMSGCQKREKLAFTRDLLPLI